MTVNKCIGTDCHNVLIGLPIENYLCENCEDKKKVGGNMLTETCKKCGGTKYTHLVHVCNNPDNKKPPLGIMPEYIWKETRAMNLFETIDRYVKAGWLPASEWIEEYHRLVKEIEEKGKFKL